MPRSQVLARMAGLAGAAVFLAAPARLLAESNACHPSAVVQQAEPDETLCCYTNPQYTGVCEVQPDESETCASIQAYLNNPRSQGKSYCGSTTIRGGWKQVHCAARDGGGAAPGLAATRPRR